MAGAGAYDTAFAEIPIELGYLGTLLYGIAAFLGTMHLLRLLFAGSVDESLLAAIGLIAWLISGSQNPLIVYEGLLFWIAVCLTQNRKRTPSGDTVREGKVGEGALAVALR